MAKRKKPKPEPLTVEEVSKVVLTAIVYAFGDRPLDVDTARKGLAHAGFELIQIALREAR